jgi:MFS family permease
MSRTAAFWITATAVAAAMFASAAPSPLYPVYQQLWGFSAATLTLVFAVYVGPLLLALLTLGSLSDHVGRRWVVAVSLGLLVAAMLVFASAGSVATLLIARAVQGLAIGAAMSALTAAMVDLQPSARTGALAITIAPSAGLGLGLAVTAFLVQYAPAPRQLTYLLAAAAILVLAVVTTVAIPERARRTRLGSVNAAARTLIPRVAVPGEVRAAFTAGVPAMIATWSLAGFMLALGTSLIERRLDVANHAAGGALLAVFFLAAALTAPLAGARRRPMRLATSFALLAVGVALVLVAALTGSVFTYAVALVAAGTGFSTAYAGVIASLSEVAPDRRGQLFAAVYIASYLAFSVPVVVSGVAADRYGLGPTSTGYAVFVLAMIALAGLALRRRRATPCATRPGRARARAASAGSAGRRAGRGAGRPRDTARRATAPRAGTGRRRRWSRRRAGGRVPAGAWWWSAR